MRKDNLISPIIILSLICLITTGLLSLTYSITKEPRRIQADLTANANRQQLFPQGRTFAADTRLAAAAAEYPGLAEAYTVRNTADQTIGYLLVSSYQGYGGAVPVMLAVNTGGSISGLKILTNDETPGLGKKVEQESFYKQFQNQSISRDFSVKAKDSGRTVIDAVSGATISSRAVTEAVNIAVRYCRQNMMEVK